MTSRSQTGMFDGARLQMTESIAFTIDSLCAYGPRFDHWAIAWSGGKDSSALLTLVIYLILAGKVPPPKRLSVRYADTRMELLPLWIAAQQIREELEDKTAALAALGCTLDIETVVAPLDDRFLVYMLGRGVPPPNNMTFRWCTGQIKIEPMAASLAALAVRAGFGKMVAGRRPGSLVYQGLGEQKLLVLTGVRQGESASRDGRIALSCSKDDAECGQGWYQRSLPGALCDTLAPILHWRVCHVWEWLRTWAPSIIFGDWSTEIIADAYGGDEAEESGARTGCVGCPLAELDLALDALIAQARWAFLAPLKRLRPLWRALREKQRRLRKPGRELLKGGGYSSNPQRLGPLTFETRLWALGEVLAIQREVNEAAERLGRPRIDMLNAEEETRIRELIAAKTWPEKWDGSEPTGDVVMESVFADGTSQPLLFSPEDL